MTRSSFKGEDWTSFHMFFSMPTPCHNFSRASIAFFFFSSFLLLLSCFPDLVSSADVTLDSIEIYKIHQWLRTEPAIYFECKGENKTVLPDVKKKNVSLTFKGEESWQPLTQFSNKKCKRCGFYEQGSIKTDDVFDEWELCPSEFKGTNGTYNHFKDSELNATFMCPDCEQLITGLTPSAAKRGKEMHWAVIVLISVAVSILCMVLIVAIYKCWQKRKREHDKLRFLKLFEEGDDEIEDELGIGPLTNAV